jgi:tellurite resistance protein TerC|tara:strand:- start:2204 stop:3202 length:999 start_codon:yes stop_codon:yes gene_type:complete
LIDLFNTSFLWVIFFIIITIGFSIDLGFFNKLKDSIRKNKGENQEITQNDSNVQQTKQAYKWSIAWISLALLFSGMIFLGLGTDKFLEYITAYTLEKSLSVDNMFVFSLIFTSLAIPLAYQHRVLSVGILTAILLRVPLLLVGATLLERFQFMIYIFGALLIYAALKILLRKEEKKIKIEKNLGVKLLGRLIPFSPELKKEQFFVKKNAIRHATPMLVALVVVEMSDLMFAIDSIPAVLTISSDPFILITSNIFALLGLRSLYFLLAGLMEKFYYFRHTLIILLFFIGVKMILSEFFHIRVEIALALILTILSASVLLSYIRQHRINLEKNP